MDLRDDLHRPDSSQRISPLEMGRDATRLMVSALVDAATVVRDRRFR